MKSQKINDGFYYLVGLEGAGKSTYSSRLSDLFDNGIHIRTSELFLKFLKSNKIDSFNELDRLDSNYRENLTNEFHKSLRKLKSKSKKLFLDAHMNVDNSVTGTRINAMASKNNNIADGIIFLNTSSHQVLKNIVKDIKSNAKIRVIKAQEEIARLSEHELQTAEDYCLKNKLNFFVINNNQHDGKSLGIEIISLDKYYLPYSDELRYLYKKQFTEMPPHELRITHKKIGERIYHLFFKKIKIRKDNFAVISVPRSGHYIADGFTHIFDGPFFIFGHLDKSGFNYGNYQNIVIIDSVIDTGDTIVRIVNKLSSNKKINIHVICLSINLKSFNNILSLGDNVHFHCIGFSNKENRPRGKHDMGARLFGTPN